MNLQFPDYEPGELPSYSTPLCSVCSRCYYRLFALFVFNVGFVFTVRIPTGTWWLMRGVARASLFQYGFPAELVRTGYGLLGDSVIRGEWYAVLLAGLRPAVLGCRKRGVEPLYLYTSYALPVLSVEKG